MDSQFPEAESFAGAKSFAPEDEFCAEILDPFSVLISRMGALQRPADICLCCQGKYLRMIPSLGLSHSAPGLELLV